MSPRSRILAGTESSLSNPQSSSLSTPRWLILNSPCFESLLSNPQFSSLSNPCCRIRLAVRSLVVEISRCCCRNPSLSRSLAPEFSLLSRLLAGMISRCRKSLLPNIRCQDLSLLRFPVVEIPRLLSGSLAVAVKIPRFRDPLLSASFAVISPLSNPRSAESLLPNPRCQILAVESPPRCHDFSLLTPCCQSLAVESPPRCREASLLSRVFAVESHRCREASSLSRVLAVDRPRY